MQKKMQKKMHKIWGLAQAWCRKNLVNSLARNRCGLLHCFRGRNLHSSCSTLWLRLTLKVTVTDCNSLTYYNEKFNGKFNGKFNEKCTGIMWINSHSKGKRAPRISYLALRWRRRISLRQLGAPDVNPGVLGASHQPPVRQWDQANNAMRNPRGDTHRHNLSAKPAPRRGRMAPN